MRRLRTFCQLLCRCCTGLIYLNFNLSSQIKLWQHIIPTITDLHQHMVKPHPLIRYTFALKYQTMSIIIPLIHTGCLLRPGLRSWILSQRGFALLLLLWLPDSPENQRLTKLTKNLSWQKRQKQNSEESVLIKFNLNPRVSLWVNYSPQEFIHEVRQQRLTHQAIYPFVFWCIGCIKP